MMFKKSSNFHTFYFISLFLKFLAFYESFTFHSTSDVFKGFSENFRAFVLLKIIVAGASLRIMANVPFSISIPASLYG